METSRNQQKPIRIHTQQIERPQTTEQVAATSQIIEKQKHDMGLPRPSRAMIKDPLPKEELLLKSLLYIPEGRCITRNSNEHTGKSPNCYLVCRMFWDEEASKSQVCWNAMDPEFNFNQVSILRRIDVIATGACVRFFSLFNTRNKTTDYLNYIL